MTDEQYVRQKVKLLVRHLKEHNALGKFLYNINEQRGYNLEDLIQVTLAEVSIYDRDEVRFMISTPFTWGDSTEGWSYWYHLASTWANEYVYKVVDIPVIYLEEDSMV